jgi:hypothetical protein
MFIRCFTLIILLIGCTNRDYCEEAKLRIATYEECQLAKDCYLTEDERYRLIQARVMELQTCKRTDHL